MTLDQIKDTVRKGHSVYWKNARYDVVNPTGDQWLIRFSASDYSESFIGLTWSDGVTLNGEESEFYSDCPL